jgi:hypothetical protein
MNRDRIIAALALLLVGCGPTRQFDPSDWSVCGAVAIGDRATGERSWLDGSQLREAESALLFELQRHSKLDTRQACASLAGMQIYTRDTPCWTDPYGRSVCGLTWCNYNVMEIGTPAHWQNWQSSTLPHELVHAMQRCETPGDIDPGLDDAHSNWARLGVGAALQALETLP